MSYTQVDVSNPLDKKTKIVIKPFFDPNIPNMGLENYNMVLFEGVTHAEQLACIEKNGVKRYITGLDEFAPEVKKIADPEEKAAKIKSIRQTVSQLEKELNGNYIDPEDEKFWEKVELLSPHNSEFWDKITIVVGNDDVYLDPTDPHDIIKLHAIKAGGFSIVAPSYEHALNMPKPPKFYLNESYEESRVKTSNKVIKNKALSLLQKMYDDGGNKLFYVAKVVMEAAHFKKSTSRDLIYDTLDGYITGKTAKSQIVASERFIKYAKMNNNELRIRSIVSDAMMVNLIIKRTEGYLDRETKTLLGKNIEEVVQYFKNPIDEDIRDRIVSTIEQYWNE